MQLGGILQRLNSLWWERVLGIDTTGHVEPTVKWGVHYTALPYQVIHQVLDHLEMAPNDSFVDIGCGKGRVLCCAARRNLHKVVGIEVNPILADDARLNAAGLRGRCSPIEVFTGPAEEFDYSAATVLYLYNPFGVPIMEKVFKALSASYERRPRKIKIAYVNCVHESVLEATGWLGKTAEWPASKFPAFGCPVSFWAGAP